jgi:protein-tyrosine-phosphatase
MPLIDTNLRTTIVVPFVQDRSALNAIHSLGRSGYRIATTFSSTSGVAVSSRSRYIAEMILTPDPTKKPKEFRDWLEERLLKNPSECVLPVNEAVIAAAINLRQRGFTTDRFIMPRDEHLEFTLSKFRATEAAESVGIPTPKTIYLRCPGHGEILQSLSGLTFPLIVKWDNFEAEDGSYHQGGNRIVMNQKDFLDVVAELEPSPCGVIAQEIVPGRGGGAFFLRHNGNVVLRFAHRRLHEVPWTGGVSSMCESSNVDRVLNAGERLLEAIDYEGVAMVEFRQEPGGVPVFLEINGRLWGSLGLALRAGADFPRAMVECHLTGSTSVVQPRLSRRIRWRNLGLEFEYLRSVFTKPAPAGAAKPSRSGAIASFFWHSIDPRTKSDVFWWDDPRQGLLTYWRILRAELARIKHLVSSIPAKRRQRLEMNRCVRHSEKVLVGLKDQKPKNILFLCYGNICRSPYAEFRWNELRSAQSELPACGSGGFHDHVERCTPLRFQSAARHRGLELRDHRSRRVNQEMVEAADLIVLMDRRNWLDFTREFPTAVTKTILLGVCDDAQKPEIPDPYDQPVPAGAIAYSRIDSALSGLVSRLIDTSKIANS